MKFFIDTANLDEIKEAASLGVLDGVTTNPSLVAREKNVDFIELLKEICKVVDGPISAEVVSTDLDGMLKEGHELAKLHKNITVKLPLIKAGLQACKIFTSEASKPTLRCVFRPIRRYWPLRQERLLSARLSGAWTILALTACN